MDNSEPQGHPYSNFEADPEYYVVLQQALEVARKEATPLPTDPRDWVAPDGTIDPLTAGEFYQSARRFLEVDIFNFVDRYSPAAWLWYLRRLPMFFFDFENSHASAYATSDLAEITTSRPGEYIGQTEPESLKPLRYRMDGDVTVNLVQLCGKIHVLRRIHQRIRTAGKEVMFRYVPGDFPVPAPTGSQQHALRAFDQRRAKQHLFAQGTGTPLGELGSHPDAILVASKDFADRQVIPTEAYDADAKQFSADQEEEFSFVMRPVRTADGVEISSKFTLREVSLPHLRLFSPQHLDGTARLKAAQLIMLLRLVRSMLITENPAYRVFQASQYGYILQTAEGFLEQLRSSFDELAEVALRLIPEVPMPVNAEALLANLEEMTGSSWPMVFGPVIRRIAESLMIDFYSATMRLDHILSFKAVTGELANRRAQHFEDIVQRIIDDSPWGEVPKQLRDLRLRSCLRRADGTPLTDIDAIGVHGTTVLIVDCKSRIQSPNDLFLGAHRTARNGAVWLETEVVKNCRRIEQYLRQNPVHPDGSYDFSNFENLVVVACTSEPVYVELGMVRNSRPEVTELLSTREVMPGLPAAVSTFELAEWLYSRHTP
jgi:hypothetical protein